MPRPDPNASDWTDLDLPTVSEATERLDAELARVRAEIAALGEGADAERLAIAAHRLDLLKRARERIGRPTAVVKPGRVRCRAEVEATPGPPD